MRGLLALAVLVALGCSPAHAAKKPTLSAQVTAVAADHSVTLSRTGHAVFADVLYPDAALVERWFAAHLLQQTIAFTERGEDRYGRMRVASDAVIPMLRAGVAVLFAATKSPKDWLAAEAEAVKQKRGVWGSPAFVQTSEQAAQHIGEFHVVEGVITRIYEAKAATYVNFGRNWHTDFSVTIPARVRRSFTKLLAELKPGTQVQVRGMIASENGPMITLMRPEQLEIR